MDQHPQQNPPQPHFPCTQHSRQGPGEPQELLIFSQSLVEMEAALVGGGWPRATLVPARGLHLWLCPCQEIISGQSSSLPLLLWIPVLVKKNNPYSSSAFLGWGFNHAGRVCAHFHLFSGQGGHTSLLHESCRISPELSVSPLHCPSLFFSLLLCPLSS